MTTRIYAVPDNKGMIRVACGDTTVEIVVIPPGGGGGPVGGPGPGGGGGVFDDPKAMIRTTPAWRRERPYFDQPLTFHYRPGEADQGHIDIDSIVRGLEDEIGLPGRKPKVVIVDGARAIDVHQVEALSNKISNSDPDLGIAFDFGDDE